MKRILNFFTVYRAVIPGLDHFHFFHPIQVGFIKVSLSNEPVITLSFTSFLVDKCNKKELVFAYNIYTLLFYEPNKKY